MKKTFIFTALLILLLTACDSHKNEAKQIVLDFLTADFKKDSVTMGKLYPLSQCKPFYSNNSEIAPANPESVVIDSIVKVSNETEGDSIIKYKIYCNIPNRGIVVFLASNEDVSYAQPVKSDNNALRIVDSKNYFRPVIDLETPIDSKVKLHTKFKLNYSTDYALAISYRDALLAITKSINLCYHAKDSLGIIRELYPTSDIFNTTQVVPIDTNYLSSPVLEQVVAQTTLDGQLYQYDFMGYTFVYHAGLDKIVDSKGFCNYSDRIIYLEENYRAPTFPNDATDQQILHAIVSMETSYNNHLRALEMQEKKEQIRARLTKEKEAKCQKIINAGLGIIDFHQIGDSDSKGFSIEFFNPSNKDIKYVTFSVCAYNQFDDPINTDGYLHNCRIEGPIYAKNTGGCSFDNVFEHNVSVIDHLSIVGIRIEYMNGGVRSVVPKNATLPDNWQEMFEPVTDSEVDAEYAKEYGNQ